MVGPELLIRARLLVQSSPPTWPPGQFLDDAPLAETAIFKSVARMILDTIKLFGVS